MNKKAREGLKKAEKKVEKLRPNVIQSNIDGAEKVGKTIDKIFHPDKRKLTIGQRTSDWITKWAGSWFFIISFLILLALWMILNTTEVILGVWDKYPYILLNLVLSCLAAIQAPVILMSQNRAAQRDRLRAEYDYTVNRKAEKEIQEVIKQLNRIEDKLRKKR